MMPQPANKSCSPHNNNNDNNNNNNNKNKGKSRHLTINFERVNTVHYYEYIQAQPNSSNSPERTPLPIPNMTENVSYGQAPVRSDFNERYNTSPSTLNRNDSQRPVEGGTNWSGKSYEEERERYVSMNANLPSSANSSQMVMYI